MRTGLIAQALLATDATRPSEEVNRKCQSFADGLVKSPEWVRAVT